MTLHIFNPEHDIALASGLSNFTAPHAGRQLRHDLGFLPALWAKEDDCILVDDVDYAKHEWPRLRHRVGTLLGAGSLLPSNPEFAAFKPGVCCLETPSVEPWGWNSALRALLLRSGVSHEWLPTPASLAVIRNLSHRRVAAWLLPQLRSDAATVGEAFEIKTAEEAESLLARYGHLVLKAPWSSSGRGLRFVSTGRTPFAVQARWFRNLVQSQGSVMAEPYYNKVKDFGMEFYSDGQGAVNYLGLSLFHTVNGAYVGNVLATEKVKREALSRFVTVSLLDSIQQSICRLLGDAYRGKYMGPFGVDMMIVAGNEGFRLHPCVEINLRRTMGHVALAIAPHDDDIQRVMRLTYANDNYQLKIEHL